MVGIRVMICRNRQKAKNMANSISATRCDMMRLDAPILLPLQA